MTERLTPSFNEKIRIMNKKTQALRPAVRKIAPHLAKEKIRPASLYSWTAPTLSARRALPPLQHEKRGGRRHVVRPAADQ